MSSVTRFSGHIPKGWGYEYIFATNDLYCGKILHFNKVGNKFSMHFHHKKDETWYVQKGLFTLKLINTENGSIIEQLIALEDDSEIIEVSTADSAEDNFRVMPGDNQNG